MGLSDDVKRAAPQLVEAPDYETRVGYLHLVDSDLRRILTLAGATQERPFVVFIDDLDRCGYKTVAEVIEALNVFLSGGYDNCIFVIAMEPDLIAAQIHAAYESLFKHLGGDGQEIGWRFLEKMIQLPLSLPVPSEPQLTHYVDRLTGRTSSEATSDGGAPPAGLKEVEEVQELLRTADDGTGSISGLADAVELVRTSDELGLPPDDRVLAEAALHEFDMRFDGDGAREIILRFVNDLSGNPREIKRFVNVFRFYAYIDLQRQIRNLPPIGIDGAAKLARLAVGWPSLLSMLTEPSAADDARTVLACLEEAPDDAAWTKITDATPERLRDMLTRSVDLREVVVREPLVGMQAASFI